MEGTIGSKYMIERRTTVLPTAAIAGIPGVYNSPTKTIAGAGKCIMPVNTRTIGESCRTSRTIKTAEGDTAQQENSQKQIFSERGFGLIGRCFHV